MALFSGNSVRAIGLTIAGAMVACDDPREKSEPYTEIDHNTYIIHDTERNSDVDFGRNLAAFRKDVAGDFLLLPHNSSYPLSYDVMAVRATVDTSDGEVNSIDLRAVSFGRK